MSISHTSIHVGRQKGKLSILSKLHKTWKADQHWLEVILKWHQCKVTLIVFHSWFNQTSSESRAPVITVCGFSFDFRIQTDLSKLVMSYYRLGWELCRCLCELSEKMLLQSILAVQIRVPYCLDKASWSCYQSRCRLDWVHNQNTG